MVTPTQRIDQYRPKPGFQASETTGVEVIIYPQGGDPITVSSDPVGFSGKKRGDPQPAIISASVQKTLGAASGSWSVTCKPAVRGIARDLFDDVVDDDWIDIVFLRHKRRWHTMRGVVGDVRRVRAVAGSGATSGTWTISGSDFGAIWERTSIWFNTYSEVNLGGAISQKVFSAADNILGSPRQAVVAFLQSMLRELGTEGGGMWTLPRRLPNRGNGSFIEAVRFDLAGYPAGLEQSLVALSQNWLNPNGNLWQLAKEWSDPLFNELFCDIAPKPTLERARNPDGDRLPQNSELVLTFRERPFPTIADGKRSRWFDLPLAIVPREQIISDDLGHSGAERYNAFFVSPQLTQEVLKSAGVDLAQPLWDESDIDRHGFRRFDVATKYADRSSNLLFTSREFRQKIRDWYCLNPYLLNGTINLATIRPDIKIGTRIRIPGPRSTDEDETFYVEQVAHNWAFGSGGRTMLGVTRGWQGTDGYLLDALNLITSRYSIPPAKTKGT